MGWEILALVVGSFLIWLPISSALDARLFKDERTRGIVLIEDKLPETDEQIFKAYLRQNVFETSLFIAGLLVGYLLSWF